MKKKLIGIIFIFSFSTVLSQEYYFRQFTTENGLPTKVIYEIFCSPDGFVWMGSDIGLIRYDGREFKLFTTDDGLPDTEVLHVFGDAEGRIWGITFSNKIFFMKDEQVFSQKNKPFMKKLDIARSSGSAIIMHDTFQSNEVFLYVYNRVIQVKGDSVFALSNPDGAEELNYQNMFQYKNKLYVLSRYNTKINILEIDSNRLKYADSLNFIPLTDFHTNSTNYYLYDNVINNDKNKAPIKLDASSENTLNGKFYVDKENRIWFHSNDKGLKVFTDLRWKTVFKNYRISNVSQDFEGNFWISTVNNGVLFLENDFFNKIHLKNYNNDINSITSIYIDSQNRLWIGNEFSQVSIYDHTEKIAGIILSDSNTYCRIVKFDFAKKMLIASDCGLFEENFDEKNFTQHTLIDKAASYKSITVFNENTLFAALAGKLNRISRVQQKWEVETIYEGRTFSCLATPNGEVWFSSPLGLSLFYQNKVTQKSISEIDGLRILDIKYNPNDNTLLLSADGNGLYVYDPLSGKIKWHITEQQGLTSNLCRKMQLSGDTLYVATPKGLNRIKLSAHQPIVLPAFATGNGLPSNDIKCFFVKGNTLALGGDFGVLLWKNFLSAPDSVKPLLHITSVISDKGTYTHNENIISEYQKGFVRINYSAISFKSTPPVFEYQVDAGEWNKQDNGKLELRNLSPGRHHISYRLQGDTKENLKTLTVFIKAPFYKQSWFLPLFIACITLLISGIVFYWLSNRKQKEIEKLQLNEKLAFAEQQALQTMMNPHFIFNAINSVQQYIIHNDAKEANRYLTQFARLIRSNLETAKNKFVSLEEELERLSLYLQFEKIRFGEKLSYSIFVSPELESDKLFIPSMVIQPFVENAIWHGVVPAQANGKVLISVVSENNELLIKVEDDGVGYKKKSDLDVETSKTSLGINITKKRLSLLSENTGKEYNIKIHSRYLGNKQTKGTTVIITLPLESDTIHSFISTE